MDPIQRKNDQFVHSLASAGDPAEAGSPLGPLVPAGYSAEAAKALARVPPELRRLIFDAGRETGEFEGINRARQVITIDMLDKLYQIKRSKSYRASGYVNWDNFCEKVLGCNHEVIDEQIAFVKKFGPEFLEAAKKMSISRRVLREMRALPDSEIQAVVRGGAVCVDGEEIPLDADHAEEVNAVLESVVSKYRAEAQTATRKADVAAKKLLEAEVKLEARGQDIDKLRAQVEELHGGPRLEGIGRRAMELYQRIRTDMEQLTALSRELQDEPARRLMFRMYVEELEGKVTHLSQAVTLEYELPETLLHTAGPAGAEID